MLLVQIFSHLAVAIGHLLTSDHCFSAQQLALFTQLVIGVVHVHVQERMVFTKDSRDEMRQKTLSHTTLAESPKGSVNVVPS